MAAARWLLDPATSVLALLVYCRRPRALSFDTAWQLARVGRHPDDLSYRVQRRRDGVRDRPR
ncbi:hypothetical protein ACIQBJ_13785 [Kitasatospora sp. NPDC088391]|uniref:hypothetical protein n=1 Tax=Kitasatospora sp. NPDC088391 TaxID=3364074 RepID=UPI0037FD8AC2